VIFAAIGCSAPKADFALTVRAPAARRRSISLVSEWRLSSLEPPLLTGPIRWALFVVPNEMPTAG
jgi:hypothetical protein